MIFTTLDLAVFPDFDASESPKVRIAGALVSSAVMIFFIVFW
jgi:hypothetical protein